MTDLWITGGTITREPVGGARSITAGGWVMPALVDAHLHVGIAEIGGPLDLDVLERDLAHLTRTGIGAAGARQPT